MTSPYTHQPGSVQFSSVAQSCPTLCDPMNCSTPGLPGYITVNTTFPVSLSISLQNTIPNQILDNLLFCSNIIQEGISKNQGHFLTECHDLGTSDKIRSNPWYWLMPGAQLNFHNGYKHILRTSFWIQHLYKAHSVPFLSVTASPHLPEVNSYLILSCRMTSGVHLCFLFSNNLCSRRTLYFLVIYSYAIFSLHRTTFLSLEIPRLEFRIFALLTKTYCRN